MSDMHITVEAGKSKRLLTEGKLCDKNIVVEASGGDDFFEKYLTTLEENNFSYGFAGKGWTDDNFNPTRPIVVDKVFTGMFQYNMVLTNTKVPITFDYTSTGSNNVFLYCTYLVTIPSLKVTESVTTFKGWFDYANRLVTVNFTEDSVISTDLTITSSVLSNASVQTIINALKDLTGQTGQKLTLDAKVVGKMTQVQKDAITAKNWTLAY